MAESASEPSTAETPRAATPSRPPSAAITTNPPIESIKTTEIQLIEHALYRGQDNLDNAPEGIGIYYAPCQAHRYAGRFTQGKKQGLGMLVLPNGGMYAGEFHEGRLGGCGVQRDAFGGRSVGQWHDGELYGVGMTMDPDGYVTQGIYDHGELQRNTSCPEWSEVEQVHLHQAVLAEQRALAQQEIARQIERQVILDKTVAIAGRTFSSADEIHQFLRDEEATVNAFVAQARSDLVAVEEEAGRWKFHEAELKETQKNLRKEIDTRRDELQYIVKFVGVAEERQAQLQDAERTLGMLKRQFDRLQRQGDGGVDTEHNQDA